MQDSPLKSLCTKPLRIDTPALRRDAPWPRAAYHLSLTIRLFRVITGHFLRESYSLAKMQSLYSVAPANCANVGFYSNVIHIRQEYIYIYIYDINMRKFGCIKHSTHPTFHISLSYRQIHCKYIFSTYIYIYIYVCVCVCVCVPLYIYIYIYTGRCKWLYKTWIYK